MSSVSVRDLQETSELDGRSMTRICGGMFGAVLSAMASHTATAGGATEPSPGISDITITKAMDGSSPSLF